MSYEPHLKRGGELYHYRTFGSRNGYSKDPNYRPKGKKAVGKLVNGKYVYSIQPKKTSLADRFNAARKSAGNWLNDRGRDVSKAASSARKSAGKFVSKASKQVSKAASGAKKYASNAVSNIGNSAKKATKFVTGGSEARSKLNIAKLRQQMSDLPGTTTKNLNLLVNQKNYERKASVGRKVSKNAKKNADSRSIFDIKGRRSDTKTAMAADRQAIKDQKTADYYKQLNNQVGKERKAELRSNYNKAIKDYNNTLEGKAVNAANKAKKSASKALSKAGDTAKKAGESVSKFASDSFDSAKKTASEGAKRAGEFISGLGKKAGKVANDARKSIDETVDDVVKTGSKNLNKAKKKAKDFIDYKITGEGQKRDEKARKDAINKAEANLSTAKTAKDREKGLRDLIKAAGDNPSSKDTIASHWINRIKKNLDTIDRLESNIKKGYYDGKYLDRAKKELAEARIDNELTVGEFYNNKNASGKWGPMYNYKNGQKQLNQKNINPDNTPNNVSQQEWDRYVAENYGHYPNRGRRKKK